MSVYTKLGIQKELLFFEVTWKTVKQTMIANTSL